MFHLAFCSVSKVYRFMLLTYFSSPFCLGICMSSFIMGNCDEDEIHVSHQMEEVYQVVCCLYFIFTFFTLF